MKVVFRHCKRGYRAYAENHATTNMKNHLEVCPSDPLGLKGKKSKGQTLLFFQPKKGGEQGFNLIATSFSIEAARKALAKMIIVNELPFRFVENYGLML